MVTTIEIPVSLVQETLIALRTRHYALTQDQKKYADEVIQAILERQLTRVSDAISILQAAVGE